MVQIRKAFFLFCLAALAVVCVKPKQAWAAEEYKEMFQSWGHGVCGNRAENGICQHRAWSGETVKIGNYYFKGEVISDGPDSDILIGKVRISDKEDSGFKLTPLEWYGGGLPVYSNGEDAYYTLYDGTIGKTVLRRYVFRSRKEEKLLDVDQGSITTIYRGKIYLSGGYVYDIKKKTSSALKGNVDIKKRSGKYATSFQEGKGKLPAESGELTLWRITETGLKKVKTLKNASWNHGFIGDKLYYAVYKDKTMREVSVYSCKRDGSGQKKLGQIKATKKDGGVLISGIGTDNCSVSMGSEGEFVYTYATKKLKSVW